ncbi:MAG: hypothetical protein R3F43_31615 [bacterium]
MSAWFNLDRGADPCRYSSMHGPHQVWLNDSTPTALARKARGVWQWQWELIAQGYPLRRPAADHQEIWNRMLAGLPGLDLDDVLAELDDEARDELRLADELDALADELDALADELRDLSGDTRPRCARCGQLAAGRRPVEGGEPWFSRAQLALPGLEGPEYIHPRCRRTS